MPCRANIEPLVEKQRLQRETDQVIVVHHLHAGHSGALRLRSRQPDTEGGPEPLARAVGPDPTAMTLDDVAADVQAQPHTRNVPLVGIRRPPEWLEDVLRVTRRQPNTRVAHSEK